jgi:hypothetical protein
MLKLPLTCFVLFSLFSAVAAAAPEGGVADDSHSDDDTPNLVASAGFVVAPFKGITLAVEGRPTGQLYVGGMFTWLTTNHEMWFFGGPRVSYRLEVDRFALTPFVAGVVIAGGAVSEDGADRRKVASVTALGGAQASVHFGPVLFGVEATLMPLPVTLENDNEPDEQRVDAFGTVALIAGAQF